MYVVTLRVTVIVRGKIFDARDLLITNRPQIWPQHVTVFLPITIHAPVNFSVYCEEWDIFKILVSMV